jgi:rod shape-determining protein MreC
MPGRGDVSLGARFVLLALFSLALLIVDHRYSQLSRVRELLTLAVTPIHFLVDLPFSTWQSVTMAIAEKDALITERDQLRRQLTIAQYRLQDMATIELENERLRRLFDSYSDVSDEQVMIAEVMKIDLEYPHRFRINRGTADDVYVGQPILDAEGVVGQIESVSAMTAEAILITDADHALPVVIERSQVRTIADGIGDSSQLRLTNLPSSANVEVGDRIVTSGLGGIFPPGRPVAIVEDVDRRPDEGFALVTARPVASLDTDQEVLLVWYNEPGSASDETDPELEGGQ